VDPQAEGKTSVMSRVPLLPHPIALLRKYERDEACRVRGKLLPVPSNAKMNAYLKEIATLCNIPKNLTTHCARHTFATLAIEYGMPIDIIAKILGHTNTNMTRRYAKISEANISREMKKIGEMLHYNVIHRQTKGRAVEALPLVCVYSIVSDSRSPRDVRTVCATRRRSWCCNA